MICKDLKMEVPPSPRRVTVTALCATCRISMSVMVNDANVISARTYRRAYVP